MTEKWKSASLEAYRVSSGRTWAERLIGINKSSYRLMKQPNVSESNWRTRSPENAMITDVMENHRAQSSKHFRAQQASGGESCKLPFQTFWSLMDMASLSCEKASRTLFIPPHYREDSKDSDKSALTWLSVGP